MIHSIFKSLTCCIVLVACFQTKGQHSISAGTDIPLQYKIGYRFQVNDNFSLNANAGVLTSPYNDIILNIIASFGASENTINTIDEIFRFGVIYEIGAGYHLNNWIFQPRFQIIDLSAATTSQQDVERIIRQGLPVRRIGSGNNDLELKSTLYQIGFEVAREFPLENENSGIRVGFSGSFNIGSTSTLSSQVRSLEAASRLLNEELQETYRSYAIPLSLNVAYVFGF